MIKSVQIKNFKSVVDLTLELGSFNVLIGENGCGKSNVLEAIAFGGAASADKLDQEFLGSRGIRVTKPEFMFSAFKSNKKRDRFVVCFKTDDYEINHDIYNGVVNPRKWIVICRSENIMKYNTSFKKYESKNKIFKHSKIVISNYVLYSPEQNSLRKFEESNQILPLGIKGEGLFQYLKELASAKKHEKTLLQIKENLSLLDWFADFKLPKNLMSNEFSLNIKDKYLSENLQYFDQKSTNEGFLLLLFYFTLFISKDTPTFFAIDNIDSSLNPKLCMQLTKNLAELAKKHKKQVIVTTHNPAILDGLNLKDDNQRLFVVRRNVDGHTIANRIEYKPERRKNLSELWTSGIIGGLPNNF